MLYNIVIQPIEYLLEIIFAIMYRFIGNAGWAIFGVSFGVSFLTLPLYMRADAIQEQQREKEKKIKKWVDHIKKTFKGDERFMMLSTYYRQQNYHQLQSIQGIFPLLLQVPFFIAAYHFLFNLSLLKGYSFGPLSDLGAEDGLLVIAGIHINVLPVLMTAINYVSSAIYTKDLSFKDKLQPYLLALLFLVLLYRSPSGLVLYWTLNNIFSLVKNFVMKYVKNPKKLLAIISLAAGNGFIIFSFVMGKISYILVTKDYETLLIFGLVYCIFYIPLLSLLLGKKKNKEVEELIDKYDSTKDAVVFLLSLTALFGVMIPLSVISASPMEFVDLIEYKSPLYFEWTSICIFSGLFLLWGGIIYWVCGKKEKETCVKIFCSAFILSLINYFFFQAKVGSLTSELVFDTYPRFDKVMKLINLVIIIFVPVIIFILWAKIKKVVRVLSVLLLLSMTFVSAKQYIMTAKELESIEVSDFYDGEERVIPLSTDGKNVMVIMLDRAIGAYLPFILDEKPELKEKLDGFVYYPNTASFAAYTNMGSPALFGGYDYTPEAIDGRSTELLADKHDEALRLMPLLFKEDNAKITVCDVPYAGYNDFSDYSIFDDIDNLNAFHLEKTMRGGRDVETEWDVMKRNFCFYSILRTAPTIIQDDIYDAGNYMSAVASKTLDVPVLFYQSYASLESLKELSVIEESDQDTLFMYDNNITHEPCILQLPNYTAVDNIDNSDYDLYQVRESNGMTMALGDEPDISVGHYHCNMAAMLILADYFDWMREQGVYDNTRIIIVADHGRGLGQFPDYRLPTGEEVMWFNPLFMVKDFDSSGFSYDYTFMTNADTPAIAMEGIILNPVNPYTCNPVNMDGKINGINVVTSGDHDISLERNQFNYNNAPWYHVEENIFELNNWELLDK